MNLVSTVKPIHRPIIPATPAKTGGAGTGNLNAANTTPHPKPVSIDSIISFILIFNSLSGSFYIVYISTIRRIFKIKPQGRRISICTIFKHLM